MQSVYVPGSTTLADGVYDFFAKATDANNNSSALSSPLLVTIDHTAPVVSLVVSPSPNGAGWNSALPVTVTASATDVGGSGVAFTESPVSVVSEGITTVTMTATDVAGNVGSALVIVKIDTTPPTLTLPVAVTASATSVSGAIVTYPAATASDPGGSGVASLTYSQASGTVFPVGVTTVLVTAKDVAGNVTTASFPVTVFVPAPTGLALGSGQDTGSSSSDGITSITSPLLTASDSDLGTAISYLSALVSVPAVQSVYVPGSTVLADGVYDFFAKATDANNNSSALSSPLLVTIDHTAPVVSLVVSPSPNGAGWNSALPVTVTASATDVGGSGVAFTESPVSVVSEGITTVTMTATDVAGNVGSALVIVKIDTTPPTLTLPVAVTASATSVSGAIVTYPAATASDPGGSGVASLTYSQASGTVFPVGVTTVLVTAKDVAGNVTTASFPVTVFVPAPTGLALGSGQDTGSSSSDGITSITSPLLTASDSDLGTAISYLSALVSVPAVQSVYVPGSTVLADGVYDFFAKATDANNNSSALSSPLQVTIDHTAPVVSLVVSPSPNGAGWNSALPVTVTASATDVGGSGVALVQSPVSVVSEGITTVTMTATDVAGNVGSNSATVKLDKTAPVVTAPANQSFAATSSSGAVVNFVTGSATDAGGSGLSSLTYGPANGSVFPVGVTTVTMTATDVAGNVATKTFLVTVFVPVPSTPALGSGQDTGSSPSDGITDLQSPLLSSSDSDPAASVSYLSALSSSPSVQSTYVPGTTMLADGVYDFFAKATDANNNSSALSSPLLVTIDHTAPVVTAPANQSFAATTRRGRLSTS